MNISEEEYLKAKKIVDDYLNQHILNKKKDVLDLIRKDLEEYFFSNNVCGKKIEDFDLKEGYIPYIIEIYPKKPYFDENYWDEKADNDIKKIGEKYDVYLHWVSWVYPK